MTGRCGEKWAAALLGLRAGWAALGSTEEGTSLRPGASRSFCKKGLLTHVLAKKWGRRVWHRKQPGQRLEVLCKALLDPHGGASYACRTRETAGVGTSLLMCLHFWAETSGLSPAAEPTKKLYLLFRASLQQIIHALENEPSPCLERWSPGRQLERCSCPHSGEMVELGEEEALPGTQQMDLTQQIDATLCGGWGGPGRHTGQWS